MMNSKWIDWSDLYQLLALGFRLPTKELVAGLADGRYFADMKECLIGVGYEEAQAEGLVNGGAAAVSGRQPEVLLHAMRQEYTRLFTAPRKSILSLYESQFTGMANILFLNKTALDAENAYKAAGLQMKKEEQEPADYLPTELEYVRYLLMDIGQTEDLDEREKKQIQLKSFYDEHVGNWMPELCVKIKEETQEEMYRVLAELALMVNQGR